MPVSEEHEGPQAGNTLAHRCTGTEKRVVWPEGQGERQEPGLPAFLHVQGKAPRASSRSRECS